MITNVDAITVYNGRNDKETRRKKYIPTIIRNVFYAEAKGTTVTDNGVWGDDIQYKIRIPITSIIQDGRTFLPDLKYAKLDDGEALKYWTITKEDFIVREAYTGGSSSLYEDELMKHIQEQGLDPIRVKEYADNTSGGSQYLKHWRIGGK